MRDLTQGSKETRRRIFLPVLCLAFSSFVPAFAQEPEPSSPPETTAGWNQRLAELRRVDLAESARGSDYRIGPHDLLEITVFEAPELNRAVRVSAGGGISLPLLGLVPAAGLTPQELEVALQERLRERYMNDPHVGVFVREMESHPVSVFGAVAKPGVYQIRGTRTLVEVLSLAQGLAEDAGDTVVVMRNPQAARVAAGQEAEAEPESLSVNLKDLLESGEARFNVAVYPGDIVKVTRAGIVYVVGDVRKPGGFVLRSNENISVLQALALAEWLNRTAAKNHARIIRTDAEGERSEIALNLDKVLAGKADDPVLQPNDIVFIPNSAARSAFFRGLEAAVGIASGVIIYRR